MYFEIYIAEKLSELEVINIFDGLKNEYNPPLDQCVDLTQYCKKLSEKAFFCIAKSREDLVGVIAYYKNLDKSQIYVSQLCVPSRFSGYGIAYIMLSKLINCYSSEFNTLGLEVRKDNHKARHVYLKFGFKKKENRNNRELLEMGI